MTPHICYIAAVIFFVIASIPHGINFRFEWLACACVVAAQLV